MASSRKKERNAELLLLKNRFLALSKIDGTLLPLTPYYWHLLYLEEAVGGYINEFFISSIVASSAMVECSLFLEFIRVNKKYQKAGAVLPSSITLGVLIDYFKDTEVPLECLLYDLETLDKPSEIKYVEIRNKFTHGDMWRAISSPSLYLSHSVEAQKYGIPIEEYMSPKGGKWTFENISYIQLRKSLKFMNKFVEYLKEKHRK